MDVSVRAVDELSADDANAWGRLVGDAVEENPCFEPGFLIPALRHLDPEQRVRLLVVSEGPDMRLVLPVIRSRQWKRIPVSALVGWRHPYCVVGTPLVDRSRVEPTVDRFLHYVRDEASPARFCVLDWITGGPVLDAVLRLSPVAPVVYEQFERPVLHRRDDGQYLGGTTRHLRKELRRRSRQLEAAVGPVRVVDRAADPAARDRFLAMEAAGWKGAAGTAMASDAEHAAFFRDMTARFAAADRLELACLETEDGTTLAMALRLRAGEGVFQLKITYDEEYRQFSPGRALDVELLSFFQDHLEEQWVDSCTDPENTFKAHLFQGRREIRTVLLPATGRVNTAITGVLPRARRVRDAIRQRGDQGARDRSGDDTTRRSSKPASLRVELRDPATMTPTDLAAWQRLAERAVEGNPFFEPELAAPAMESLSDGLDVRVLSVLDGDELVMAAPVVWTRRWRRLHLRVARTWCHLQCFLGTPLVVSAERADAAWQAALGALTARRRRPHVLVLELMPTDGPVIEALERVAGRRVRCYERYERATLRRSSLEDGAAPLRGRRRRELERRARQAERDTGAAFVTEDRAPDPDAIEHLLALEAASWVGKGGTALDSEPGTASFARDMAARFRDEGRLVVLSTSCGSGIAAELFAFRSHGTLFMYKIAYDEALARFSPGTQLVHDMSRWFAEQKRLETIDSCAHPDNEFINRLLPDRRELATVLVALDGIGAMAIRTIPPLVDLYRRISRRGS